MIFKNVLHLFRNPAARNSFIMFFGTMIINFGAYLYQLVVIRIFGPEQYGEFATLISFLFLFSVPANVLQIVLTKYFSIYKARDHIGEARSLFVKTMRWIIGLSLLAFPIFLFFLPFLQRLTHIYRFDSFIYLYITVVGSFGIAVFSSLLNGYQRFFLSSLNMSILTFLRLLSGIAFAPISVPLTILGNAMSEYIAIVFYALSVRFLFAKPAERIQIKFSTVFSFAVPVLFSTLGMTAFFNMDVIWVKHFFDATEAGIYASLTIFGKIIFFAASPIVIVVFPMIAERKEKSIPYASLFYFGLFSVAILSSAIVGMYMFLGEFVIRILFGEAFMNANQYISQYGVFMAFVTMLNYLMTVCLAINKTIAGFLVFIGSIVHSVVILFFHASLYEVIVSISFVSGILTLVLLLYYRYGKSFQ